MSVEIAIAGKSYSVSKAKLRKWFELEDKRNKVYKAAEKKSISDISKTLCSYISAACGELTEVIERAGWLDVATAFMQIETLNQPSTQFPLFLGTGKHDIIEDIAWDYEGRSWYSILHTLASKYNWTIEYISELEVADGIALLQEILVENQLEREWWWGMSEVAYSYDKNSKTSKFNKLPRPAWMNGKAKPLEIRKMLKSMLPVGNIIDSAKVGLHGTEAIKH